MFIPLRHVLLVPLLTVGLLWTAAAALADDDSSMPQAPSAEQLAEWIQQLDASQFSARTEASRNLQSVGRAAFAALAEAARGESRETRMRALEILRKHFEDGDAGTQQAAREVLEKIAAGPHEAAASRAKEILDPKPEIPELPPVILALPQIQIQLNAVAGRQMQRIQIANGVKRIEAEDDKRKIKICDDPAQGISMEVTEEKDGQQTTKKYTAKTAEELKKNHPEAHQLYEKYGKQLGGVQIQAAALPGGLRLPGAARQAGIRMLGNSRRLLESGIRQLEQSEVDGEADQQVQQSTQRLKEIARQLEEEERKLSQP